MFLKCILCLRVCGYTYNEEKARRITASPGTLWKDIPDVLSAPFTRRQRHVRPGITFLYQEDNDWQLSRSRTTALLVGVLNPNLRVFDREWHDYGSPITRTSFRGKKKLRAVSRFPRRFFDEYLENGKRSRDPKNRFILS